MLCAFHCSPCKGLRISRGLSWNNPARLQLMELAERLERQAKEFELQNHLAEKVA